jgi:D-glycero-beta-D-manno-heptose 1-phosphate adenylyltransferase
VAQASSPAFATTAAYSSSLLKLYEICGRIKVRRYRRASKFARRPATLRTVSQFYSRAELVLQRAIWKRQGKTVVFTNGCFDLLHRGHIRLLEQARSLGDILILALNSDSSVRRAKGPSRPLSPEKDRIEVALALEAVDAVTVFDEDLPRDLIAAVAPDILVKGSDWSHFVSGREEVEKSGGQVVTVPLQPGHSTTEIVNKILN